MQKSILLGIMLLFLSSCAPVEPLADRTIEHQYQNLHFDPVFLGKDIEEEISLIVKPIDASTLNDLTFEAAFRSGDYEQEVFEEYMVISDRQSLSDTEKRYYDHLVDFSNDLISKMNSGDLSRQIGLSLIDRVWEQSDGKIGVEFESISNPKGFPNYNPFFDGRGYQSVFKLIFENNSSEVKEVEFNKFQVATNSEVFYPHNMDYFSDRFARNNGKLENAYRFNMPNTLTVAPGQTVEKYLAIPAIGRNTENITVQYFTEKNEVKSYSFKPNVVVKEQEIIYKQFLIEPSQSSDYDYFYALTLNNGATFSLRRDRFYIPKDQIDQSITMCTVRIPNSRRAQHRFACSELELSEYPSGRIDYAF